MAGGNWERYFHVRDADGAYAECRQRCRNAFAEQRANIRRIFEASSPKTVCCLGAGVLNDVPYREMVDAGTDLHLVDWLPGSLERGISMSIIDCGDSGQPCCLYCNSQIARPEQYCAHFESADHGAESCPLVCDRFVLNTNGVPSCEAFQKAERPAAYYEDVTGGFASEFGRRLEKELRKVRSWKQAVEQGNRLARRLRGIRRPMSVQDGSMEFVTSSMVVSQFEHEPYTFFTTQAAKRLGAPTQQEQDELQTATQELQSLLFVSQVEGHCEEIKRILSPSGRCYISFEMFHAASGNRDWFMVHDVDCILRELSSRFHFDFELLSERETVTRFSTDTDPSVVYSFVLKQSA